MNNIEAYLSNLYNVYLYKNKEGNYIISEYMLQSKEIIEDYLIILVKRIKPSESNIKLLNETFVKDIMELNITELYINGIRYHSISEGSIFVLNDFNINIPFLKMVQRHFKIKKIKDLL